jgi:hypothetical protein
VKPANCVGHERPAYLIRRTASNHPADKGRREKRRPDLQKGGGKGNVCTVCAGESLMSRAEGSAWTRSDARSPPWAGKKS